MKGGREGGVCRERKDEDARRERGRKMWAAGIQPWADSGRLLEMFICWFLAETVSIG